MGAGASAANIDKEYLLNNPSAIVAASRTILDEIHIHPQGISVGRATEILHKYEVTCSKVQSFFPGAQDGRYILEKVDKTLVSLGCTASNTLYAQSICPDEVNHARGNITTLFSTHLGEVFHMGGLAGLPFTGRTGFAAFSHHTPDDGNLFILFGPHIGVSEAGKFGKYTRIGQSKDGSACGAACAALNHCLNSQTILSSEKLGSDPNDFQMNYIISEVYKRLNVITAHSSEDARQAELVKQMFEIAKENMEQIVSTNFGHGHSKLILLGGIQVNMPAPLDDLFQPLLFEVRENGCSTRDLMVDLE